MIVALAGHVDHGKTSIVKALTGVDTDRLAEEKRRGLTIDLGFAYADINGHRIGFVDVPGHHRFVHNMVAGIAGRQYALLVVAADDGVMPQSREHLQILDLLGLTAGAVALNKVDRVDASRLVAVRRQIRALTAGSFLEQAKVLELSCASGQGIAALRDHLANETDPTNAPTSPLADRAAALFRLPIDRAFNVRGSGLVVTGTVVSGSVAVGDQVAVGGGERTVREQVVRIRGLHVQSAPATSTNAGDRAAINLAGGIDEVGRGDWLLAPRTAQASRRFAAALSVVDDFPRRLKHNAPVHVYHATSHSQGRVLLIDSAALTAGGRAIVDVTTQRELHVKVGDRIVLRDHDLERTLGGACILEVEAPARRRPAARRNRLANIRPDDPAATLTALARQEPISLPAFARHWNMASELVHRLAVDGGLRLVDEEALHPDLVAQATAAVHAELETHHRQHPASAGLASSQFGAGIGNATTRCVLALLVDAGALRLDGGHYALASHRATVPDEVLRLFAAVEASLDSKQPPSLGDIGKRLQRPFAALERQMRALPAFGLAIRISENRYYLPQRLLELAAVASDLAAVGPFTVRQFRDAAGVGRNIVIEVLEHFDAKGFTRRDGDTRTVVGEPAVVVAP